jgi:hypothetical protein
VDALTTSRVVTPKSFLGLNTLDAFMTSEMTGTSELTGLETTNMNAFEQVFAISFAKPRTIFALSSNKSVYELELGEGDLRV